MTRQVKLAVGAVVLHHDHVLLVRRATHPRPGAGRSRAAESNRERMADAAAREVREETGLDVEISRPLDWVERIGPDHHFVIVDFAATVSERQTPTPGDDAAGGVGSISTRSRPAGRRPARLPPSKPGSGLTRPITGSVVGHSSSSAAGAAASAGSGAGVGAADCGGGGGVGRLALPRLLGQRLDTEQSCDLRDTAGKLGDGLGELVARVGGHSLGLDLGPDGEKATASITVA